ncbi:HD-GYP domain-containing protein [Treponema sp.]|uniref:HD-GYP domain-containing protein n=1 Tax=Treponema sp. TaxID=166 RepID=UPI00298EA4C9|nr:HD domain-containing phosphohydrolase [Treponema sp.]MCQ2241345.1 hypothetical protein [Treponema sp.]
MSEKDEIAREVLPFLMDLFPGVPVSTFITIFKYFSIAVFSFLGIFVLSYVVVRFYIRHKSERYIKNLDALNSIEKLDADDARKKMLRDLILQCVILGAKIDFHTNRKNNSKSVSQIIWEMCCDLGLDKETSILYTCAAMVYDVGFLDVNAVYFHTEVLSAKERKLLRAHIMNSYEHLLFVPEDIRSVFFDAAMFHHENYNGSGYPEGLHDEEIPKIAQMIRVSETFVSLTSKRSYRKVFQRDEALKILNESSYWYAESYLKEIQKIV